MKKIFALIVILLCGSNVFSQGSITDLSDIEKSSISETTYSPTFEEMLTAKRYGNISIAKRMKWTNSVKFLKDGKIYMLAYEPLVIPKGRVMFVGERKVYLYYKDTSNIDLPWVLASDLVWTCYRNANDQNYEQLHLDDKNTHYMENGQKKYLGDFGEIIFEGDTVHMTIALLGVYSGSIRTIMKPITFTFIPIEDGKYKLINTK